MRKYPLYDEIKKSELRLGDHLVLIYNNKAHLFGIVIPFLEEGLENNFKCLCIIDDPTAEEIKTQLRKVDVDVDSASEKGQLVITTCEDIYTKDGAFDPDAMITFLKTYIDTARKEGYTALRFTGEPVWALTSLDNMKLLIEYEAKLDLFSPGKLIQTICLYDENKFSEGMIASVLQIHPLVIYREKIFRNRYHIPPAELLSDLERKGFFHLYETP